MIKLKIKHRTNLYPIENYKPEDERLRIGSKIMYVTKFSNFNDNNHLNETEKDNLVIGEEYIILTDVGIYTSRSLEYKGNFLYAKVKRVSNDYCMYNNVGLDSFAIKLD